MANKLEEIQKRMQGAYGKPESSLVSNDTAPATPIVTVPSIGTGEVKDSGIRNQAAIIHTGKRGRPKGSCTRKEEYRRVGFEGKVSLLDQFDRVAKRKGLMRREAFEAALQCFIANK